MAKATSLKKKEKRTKKNACLSTHCRKRACETYESVSRVILSAL
jgi:hypothetical protein